MEDTLEFQDLDEVVNYVNNSSRNTNIKTEPRRRIYHSHTYIVSVIIFIVLLLVVGTFAMSNLENKPGFPRNRPHRQRVFH
jgi:hypothetical protein